MNKLIDKIIVFTLCMASCLQYESSLYIVVPVICALGTSALLSYVENKNADIIAFIVYCGGCTAFPVLLFFLPLICYDVYLSRRQYIVFISLIPIGTSFSALPPLTYIYIVLFAVLAYLIKLRTVSLEKLRNEYVSLRDTTKEFSMRLEGKNRELLEKQDYEINLATLNERNRIARDIHDSIGHLLSNSILQTGALITLCKDESIREKLVTLKDTLSQGMDSIRDSIHDLHDESIDLYTEVKALADSFRFCEISLDYDVESNPGRSVKYAILAVVKEALSNVIKHSDATAVRITLREHPALYQLVVKDNGSEKVISGDGIGLKNIEQRVFGLKGLLNISYDKGFTVFISIPKEAV